ncbi:hypothetical protein CAC42_7050 [Sphaceloma murrayae]|uniref:Chromo domain-containing protein n=1 Tax=Sphaceloma murrayae TaxID=2082308 RepID=A0A2K1QQJ3_9PEZI|nr:hypothetical protein CAC42_7050 [Sphaceloma murrayae]
MSRLQALNMSVSLKPTRDKPLSTRLSNHASRPATIISRQTISAAAAPTYTLDIDGVTVRDVCVDSIFDFVSPQDLEIFENASFKRENDEKDMIQKALWQAARRPGRPRKDHHIDGVASRSIDSEVTSVKTSDDGLNAVTDAAPTIGRNGRPRPSYSHMYLKRGRPRKDAGLSRAEWQAQRALSSELDLPMSAASLSISDVSKRRKLDHPGLQPRSRLYSRTSSTSGADYDQAPTKVPNASSVVIGDTGKKPASAPVEPLIHISDLRVGGSNTRPLTGDSDSDRTSSTVSSSSISSSASSTGSPSAQLVREQHTASQRKAKSSSPRKARPTPPSASRSRGSQSSQSLHAASSPPSRKPPMNSKPQPTPSKPEAEASQSEDDSDSTSSDTYEIESILAHHLSDPKTHPAELGKEPVMLYQVKWAGYDELTWEPVESFDDQEIVERYWERIEASRRPSITPGRDSSIDDDVETVDERNGGKRWKGKERA